MQYQEIYPSMTTWKVVSCKLFILYNWVELQF